MKDNNVSLNELIKGWGLNAASDGELIIGGCKSLDLVRYYGTPLHVVNETRLICKAEHFQNTLKSKYPGKVSVHFAFKCNPVPGIIKIIKQTGINAEVMSEFELLQALKLGYSGEEIIVNGPYKTDQLISSCIENNIRFINVDSITELERIEGICEAYNKGAQVLLRINPDFIPGGMNNGSKAASRSGSHFGMDLKGGEVSSALEMIKSMKRVIFKGFHFHIGSGIQDTDEYRKALSGLKNIVHHAESLGFRIDVIDIGGGLGVSNSKEMTTTELLFYQAFDRLNPSVSPNMKLSFRTYADSVTEGILSLFSGKKIPELITEPGRCITGPNQLLLLNVHQVKERKNIRKWLVTNAGIGTLTMPTYYEHHEVILCNDVRRRATEKVTITGPGCFSADVVYRNKMMPSVASGETLAILDSGAYFTSWESSFGFPRPAIISVKNGHHKLLRQRETFSHLNALDIF